MKKAMKEVGRLNREGGNLLSKSDYPGALSRFTEAVDLIHKTASEHGLANEDILVLAGLYNNKGHCEVRIRNYTEAVVSFHHAARLYDDLSETVPAGYQYGNIGSVYRDKEAFDSALENYTLALSHFEKAAFPPGIADQCGNIGYVYFRKKDPETALEWFKKAFAIYMEAGDREKAEMIRKNMETLESPGGKDST